MADRDILNQRFFFMKQKLDYIYITLIRPVLLYGLEKCTLSKADENRLGTFERGILRKICGPVKEKDKSSNYMNSTKN
jgi:hypothetical protein